MALADGPNVPVRHLAFFRAASAEVEGSHEYRGLVAGVVVLRLLDKWRSLTREPALRPVEFEPVERDVAALEDGALRNVLHRLVRSVAAFIDGSFDPRVAALLAYGQLLEHDARWDVAADVYLTAIELGSTNRSLLPLCFQRASTCFRKLGLLDRAQDLLLQGVRAAAEHGDEHLAYMLRITVAKLAIYKGNLPEAEEVLGALIVDTDASGSSFRAEARHTLGQVAYELKQYGRAIEYFYAALRLHTDPVEQTRAMHDIAMTMGDMGHLDAARDILSTVRRSPHLPLEVRHAATLNLMLLAAMARDRAQFELLRLELVDERLEARFLAQYHIIAGQGALIFDDPSDARREFAQAVVTAREHSETLSLVEAERLLETPAVPASVPAILDDLRSRIGGFGEAAD